MTVTIRTENTPFKDLSVGQRKEYVAQINEFIETFNLSLNDDTAKNAQILAQKTFISLSRFLKPQTESGSIEALLCDVAKQMEELARHFGEYSNVIERVKESITDESYKRLLENKMLIKKEIEKTSEKLQKDLELLVDPDSIEGVKQGLISTEENCERLTAICITNAGRVTNQLVSGLSNHETPEQIADRKNRPSKGKKKYRGKTRYKGCEFKEPDPETDEKSYVLEYQNKGELIEITYDSVKIVSKNSPFKKIFYRVISQNYELEKDGKERRVAIPLKHFVDDGIYSDISNAMKGIDTLSGPFTALNIYHKAKDGNFFRGNLFASVWSNNGIAYFSLNNDLNWKVFTRFWTALPIYYYGLDPKPSELCLYIFYLARQKDKRKLILGNGYFDISVKALMSELDMPLDPDPKRAKRQIVDALEKWVQKIMEKEDETVRNGSKRILNLELKTPNNSDMTVSEFIESGFLRVHLLNDALKEIERVEKDAKDKQRKAERKQKKAESKQTEKKGDFE